MQDIDWRQWFWGAGRTGRRTYWWGFLSLVALGWLFHTFAEALAYALPRFIPYVSICLLGAEIALFWLAVCLISRRFHDVGRSGWWQILPLALAIAGLSLAEPAWAAALGLNEAQSATAFLGALIIYYGSMMALGFVRGMPEPNRFGSPSSRQP